MAPKIKPTTLLLIVTLCSVAAQTFQYSRGWTNGKRDGHKKHEDVKEVTNELEKVLTPCQIHKLKYILEGKPFTERLFAPCDYVEDEGDGQQKNFNKNERSQESLYEAFL